MSLRPNGSRDFKLGSCRKHSFFILLWWVCPWIAFVRCLMNCKIIWNVNKLFIKHNDKVFDFDWFFNNFIVHNLLINYLNLSNCSQKQLLASVCVCVCVCVCARISFHHKGFSWLKQNNKCNTRDQASDQASDVVLRKLLCVKYARRHVIDHHSRSLQASNFLRMSN